MGSGKIKYAKLLVVLVAVLLTVAPLGLAFSNTTNTNGVVSASTTIEDSQVPLAGDIAQDEVVIEDEQVPEAGPVSHTAYSVLLATILTVMVIAGGATAMVIASKME